MRFLMRSLSTGAASILGHVGVPVIHLEAAAVKNLLSTGFRCRCRCKPHWRAYLCCYGRRLSIDVVVTVDGRQSTSSSRGWQMVRAQNNWSWPSCDVKSSAKQIRSLPRPERLTKTTRPSGTSPLYHPPPPKNDHIRKPDLCPARPIESINLVVAMFLQRSAVAVARRATPAVAPALRRSFATTMVRRDAPVPNKDSEVTVQKLSGRNPTLLGIVHLPLAHWALH